MKTMFSSSSARVLCSQLNRQLTSISKLNQFACSHRLLSTSSVCSFGRRVHQPQDDTDHPRFFRHILFPNKRGTRDEKRAKMIKDDDIVPVDHRGVRMNGYIDDRGKFHRVQEMIPEFIVPNLEGCKLKPYVSYQTINVESPVYTDQDLFNDIYKNKIVDDFNQDKLDAVGNPLKASSEELLTADEARRRARRTGSDIFRQPPLIDPETRLMQD